MVNIFDRASPRTAEFHERQIHPDSNRGRKSHRYKFDEPLRIPLGENVVNRWVRNIGRNGMFIKVSSPLLVGTAFTVHLEFKEPAPINSVVRRVEPGCGVSVSIVAPYDEGRNRFSTFLHAFAHE